MKNILFLLLISAYVLFGCKNQTTGGQHSHTHESETTHDHSHEGHDHDHEGHDHNHEGHDHNHEGHDHNQEGHSQEETGAKHSDEITFTKAQAAKTDFEVKEILPATFNRVIKTTGQIMPAPGDESVIVATSNGVVTYSNSKTAEGMQVRKGEHLFNITSRNLAEGDHYSKVKAAYEKARAEYLRAETLIKDRIISQREFESIQLGYENAKIAYEAVSVNRTSNGVGVSSPINGYLKNILVKEGEYITVGQPLATVSQNKRLVLRAEVSEKHYSALKSIRSANFKTPYDNKTYDISDLNGMLFSIGKASANNTFYLPVSFEFDNKGEVIPGSFVEAYLISSPVENALVLPVSALTNELGTFYVYVQVDEEGYRKQEVSIGGNNGKEVQILKGLQPGDKVVTRGAYQVKMASASGSIPHGHSHEH